ncbi:MauE/DoxX family redox-associated membrane protein [Microbacterium sp. 22242]|uniref:MauE/DoxX family redox-associated membrane protein n=1 Tax=Microbacterium sp. 22242 TaxID=3453896 RepID=UPI003F82CB1A
MILLIILGILRIIIGVLLTLSAYGKYAQRYTAAVRDVRAYRITGPRQSEAVAIVLPAIEVFLAGCLILGAGLPISTIAAAVLFLGFAGVAISATARRIVTDCGCFGSVLRQRVGPALIVRNLIVAVVLAIDSFAAPHQLVLVQNQTEVLIGLTVAAGLGVLWGFARRADHRRAPVRT